MIIDPPVTPYSPPEEIRAWREQLRGQLTTEQDPENRAALQRAIDHAERMLELQRKAAPDS